MMSRYVRVTRTVNHKGNLVKPEEVKNYIKDDSDYYTSTYYYNQDHYNTFQKTGSIAGIKDVTSNQIWFDFDTQDGTVNDSKKDALELLERFKTYSIDPEKVEIYFSGNKGFTVTLNVNKELAPNQVNYIANKFGKDLSTFDTSMYDASQLLRIPGTKHQESGLYKFPLTTNQLKNYTIEQIRTSAKTNKPIGAFDYQKFDLNEDLLNASQNEQKQTNVTNSLQKVAKTDSFSLRNRPKGWKGSKWALVQGEMQRGERDTGCLIIAATCRSLGYDIETARAIATSALKRAHEKYGEGSFGFDDLDKKINRVYSDEWQGGSYTVESEPILQKVCDRLGIRDENPKSLTVGVDDLLVRTLDFAKNIDALTVKTGIEPLDNRLKMTIGMSVGLIAPPGAGKTSLALQMLNSMSKQGHQSIFFSYDMYDALVGIKMIQKHKNKSFNEVISILQTNTQEFNNQVKEIMRTEYENVEFCFQNGQSTEDIEETIKYVKEKKGKAVQFIVMDYNELIMTEYSDPTHSSLYVAQKIRQIASEHSLCALSLFQPSKMSGDPSQEIVSYRAAKGSSAIEQSLSIILGMSRPGCTPELSDAGWDQFAVINCLKNRFGGLFKLELSWDGVQGTVRTLDRESFTKLGELKALLKEKKAEKEEWK